MSNRTRKSPIITFWDSLERREKNIALIAAVLTILVSITGYVSWFINILDSVSITERLDSLYGCDVEGIEEGCAMFSVLDPGYMPRISFDIANQNNTPVFFNSNDAVTVEVLEYIPYDELVIVNETGGADPWTDPVYWSANIDPLVKEYSAAPNEDKYSDLTGDEFLKVDFNDLSRFILLINPSEAGYYKIRVKLSYRYRNSNKTYLSKIYNYVCIQGTNEVIKRKDELNIDGHSKDISKEETRDVRDEELVWMPTNVKAYSLSENLLYEYKWIYDDDGNLVEVDYGDPYYPANCTRDKIEYTNGNINYIEKIEGERTVQKTDYEYEDNNRLVSVNGYPMNDSHRVEYVENIIYDDSSNSMTVHYSDTAGGTYERLYTFNSDYRVASVTNYPASGTEYTNEFYIDQYGNRFNAGNDYDYHYNANGLITDIDLYSRGKKTGEIKLEYNSDNLVKTKQIVNTDQSRIMDYEYKRFKKNSITQKTMFYMECFIGATMFTF